MWKYGGPCRDTWREGVKSMHAVSCSFMQLYDSLFGQLTRTCSACLKCSCTYNKWKCQLKNNNSTKYRTEQKFNYVKAFIVDAWNNWSDRDVEGVYISSVQAWTHFPVPLLILQFWINLFCFLQSITDTFPTLDVIQVPKMQKIWVEETDRIFNCLTLLREGNWSEGSNVFWWINSSVWCDCFEFLFSSISDSIALCYDVIHAIYLFQLII